MFLLLDIYLNSLHCIQCSCMAIQGYTRAAIPLYCNRSFRESSFQQHSIGNDTDIRTQDAQLNFINFLPKTPNIFRQINASKGDLINNMLDIGLELLRRAMKDENKVANAKTVLGTKEKLLALIPTDTGILIETMFFAEEVKEAPKEPAHPEIKDAELNILFVPYTWMNRITRWL